MLMKLSAVVIIIPPDTSQSCDKFVTEMSPRLDVTSSAIYKQGAWWQRPDQWHV